MKRALTLGIVIVALLAVTAVPAVAGGDNNQNRWRGSSFGLVGQVKAVDADAGTITVLVQTGNRTVKDYLGHELTVTTSDDTLFLLYGDLKCTIVTFEAVEVDAYVSMNGTVLPGEIFMAKRVTVDVPLHALD